MNGRVINSQNAWRVTPIITGDRFRDNVLYMTWSQSGADARFQYCLGGVGGCMTNAEWCTVYKPLPSLSGCSGYDGSPGCEIEQAGDGSVWIVVADDVGIAGQDPGCTAGIDNVVHGIGLRRVTVPYDRCPASSADITLSPPECIYYAASGIQPGQMGSYFNAQSWSATLAASVGDARGTIAVAVQGWADVSTGLPCTGSTTGTPRCEEDVFLAYRRNDGLWCGASGCRAPPLRQADLLRVSGVAGSTLHHLRSNLIPVGDKFIVSWMDFDSRPYAIADGTNYVIRSALVDSLPQVRLTTPWLETGGAVLLATNASPTTELNIGDYNTAAHAALHGHAIAVRTLSDGSTVALTRTLASAALAP